MIPSDCSEELTLPPLFCAGSSSELMRPGKDCILLLHPEQSRCPAQLQPASSLPEVPSTAGSVLYPPEVYVPTGPLPASAGGSKGLVQQSVFAEGPEEPLQPSVSARYFGGPVQLPVSAEGPEEPLQPSVIDEGIAPAP